MNEVHGTIQYYIDRDLISEHFHTGSREICNPPPTDTDDDYIFLVDPEKLLELEKILIRNKWIRGGSFHNELSSTPYEGDKVDATRVFSSWKKKNLQNSELNFILTISPEFYQNFKLATKLSKKLNLTNKDDRISVFHAVCYDQWPEV